jgi:hypothetical protein
MTESMYGSQEELKSNRKTLILFLEISKHLNWLPKGTNHELEHN